ncbi:MAG: hypothetical protein J7K14_07210 [Sulfurimonas sp.]|nr:hypothetical protein [Sulfurimonas sp.]
MKIRIISVEPINEPSEVRNKIYQYWSQPMQIIKTDLGDFVDRKAGVSYKNFWKAPDWSIYEGKEIDITGITDKDGILMDDFDVAHEHRLWNRWIKPLE